MFTMGEKFFQEAVTLFVPTKYPIPAEMRTNRMMWKKEKENLCFILWEITSMRIY